jgi:hypothetical protein
MASKCQRGDPSPFRVLCNADWFNSCRSGSRAIDGRRIAVTGFLQTLRSALLAQPFDAVVILNDARQLLAFCLINLVLPWLLPESPPTWWRWRWASVS